jgi:hypothetical protein
MKFKDIIKSLLIGFPLTAVLMGILYVLFAFVSMTWINLFINVGMFIRVIIIVWIGISTLVYLVEYS